MLSCIYRGRLKHRRMMPPHRFEYGLYMLYVDLDELPAILKSDAGLSSRWFAPVSLLRADHLGNASIPLDQAVRDLVREKTGLLPVGPIRMLTLPRNFGYYFCPLCLYFCFDGDGTTVRQIVGEVTNTPWLEKHWYVLWDANRVGDMAALRFSHPKDFHVSPFLGMGMRYEWLVQQPGEELRVSLANYVGDQRVFEVLLEMRRRELSRKSLRRTLFCHPWMTARVTQGIYWQALRLWLKGCEFHAHPKHAGQRSSIQS